MLPRLGRLSHRADTMKELLVGAKPQVTQVIKPDDKVGKYVSQAMFYANSNNKRDSILKGLL